MGLRRSAAALRGAPPRRATRGGRSAMPGGHPVARVRWSGHEVTPP